MGYRQSHRLALNAPTVSDSESVTYMAHWGPEAHPGSNCSNFLLVSCKEFHTVIPCDSESDSVSDTVKQVELVMLRHNALRGIVTIVRKFMF